MTRKGTRVVLVLSAAVLVIVIDRSRKENRVVLVLSAAVLVIVIDARDVGPWGWRAGFTTKHTEITKVFWGG